MSRADRSAISSRSTRTTSASICPPDTPARCCARCISKWATGCAAYCATRCSSWSKDTTGVNDFCVPQCDPQRYVQDFGVSGHRNCRDNLAEAMADYDIPYEYLPEPFNFFQSSPIDSDGRLQQKGSPAKVGDKVRLRALIDVIVAVSACPQDLAPTNNYELTDLELVVRDP